MLAAWCLMLAAWCLLAACCLMLEHLPDPSTKGSTKGGRPKAASLCGICSISGFYFSWTYFGGKYGSDISKKNNKGVLGRPWTKRRVLRAISSTLKFQYFRKSWKSTCPMFGKTRSCESSREKFRMLRALLPDTPLDLPNFNLNYGFFTLCKTRFFTS